MGKQITVIIIYYYLQSIIIYSIFFLFSWYFLTLSIFYVFLETSRNFFLISGVSVHTWCMSTLFLTLASTVMAS